MKFIHLSDLHLGKRVNEISMIKDQEDILLKTLGIIDKEQPDCVIIAGDLYDKAIPTAEAVELCDYFLTALANRNLVTFIISGNHDSPERVAFGSKIMSTSKIYISPVYNGNISPITLEDEFGSVNFYLLPFLKPQHVRRFYGDEDISSYQLAMEKVVKNLNINVEERNVAISHQFFTGAQRSDSEDISIGGSDNIDGTIFDDFDYVALGHLHKEQKVGQEKIRYCGTLLKYSFSEVNHEKGVMVVELGAKEELTIKKIPLTPLHDMKELKGEYNQLVSRDYYEQMNTNDYMHITLTDEEDVPEALGRLRTIYPNIMKLDYDNKRTREHKEISNETVIEKSPMDYLKTFYELQNNQPINEEQETFALEIMERLWGK